VGEGLYKHYARHAFAALRPLSPFKRSARDFVGVTARESCVPVDLNWFLPLEPREAKGALRLGAPAKQDKESLVVFSASGSLNASGSLHKEPWPLRRQGLLLAEGERWYVVRSLARREGGAEMQLLAQGFRTFSPRVSKTVRHARKLRAVVAPIFPTYMFVILDLQIDRWRSVNGTFGVAGLLMAGELPEPVPQGVVEQLLDYTDEGGIARFDRDLREGQPVRVIAGPFARALGRLERLDANGRVRVLLDIMGGKIPVLLDRSGLEAA